MNDLLFEAYYNEPDPMYDIAVIKADESKYIHNPLSNYLNNSHSVTKFFTSTAIGMLSDEGKLSLTDRVTDFFTKEQLSGADLERWNKITVIDALRHRLGFDRIPYNVDNDDDIAKIGDDFLKYVFSLELPYEPGEYRRYSDEGYYLLSRIIHSASGMKSDDFLKVKLFDKLKFKQWTMVKCPMGEPLGCGGFFARADDIAKAGFLWANKGVFQGERLLSEAYISDAMNNDYGCERYLETDIYYKTGARGQIVAFSQSRLSAVAWHGCTEDSGARHGKLLAAYKSFLDAEFAEK